MKNQNNKILQIIERLDQLEEMIYNKNGMSLGEVVKYFPESQTIKVKLLPDGLITTDIPVGSYFTGKEYGAIAPFFEGQQVLIAFVGDINNAVLVKAFYNKVDKAPTKPGIREKYGKLIGRILDPLRDLLISTPENTVLLNDCAGCIINSNKFINLVAQKPISVLSDNINQMGSVNINLPTDLEEKVIEIAQKVDDLNNKLAQAASLAEANKQQHEKMGSLVQLLTWAVHLIGLTPLKVINIYSLYPLLSGNPFMKNFTSAMTDIKAIQIFNLFDSVRGLTSIGDIMKKEGINGVKNQLIDIASNFDHNHTSFYQNFLQMDVEKVIKGDVKYIGPMIVQNLPEYMPEHSKAKDVLNRIYSFARQIYFYYEIVKKQFDRITNSAYFKKPKEEENPVGDFGTEDNQTVIA